MDKAAQNTSSSRPAFPERLRAARIAVAVQALALLVVIGTAVPGELAYLFHPLVCSADQWCLDLRGLPLLIYLMFLGPAALLLLATVWLWRRPRIWPALLPLVVDAAIIVVVMVDLLDFARTRTAEPNIAVQLLLGLVPALVTLTLVLGLLSARWRRIR